MEDKKLLSLVTKAVKGDEQAFVEICRIKAKPVLYLCIKMMKNHQDGEDAAQEVFIQMQRNITKLREPQAFSSWLYGVIVYTCNGMRRQAMRYDKVPLDGLMEELPDGTPDSLPQEYIENAEKRAQVLQVIEDLPEHYRLAVHMFYFEAMSYEEIAAAMDITAPAVNGYLRRARQIIKTKLDAIGALEKPHANPLQAASPAVSFAVAIRTILAKDVEASVTASAAESCLAAAGIINSTAGAAAVMGGLARVLISIVTAISVATCGYAVYQIAQNDQPNTAFPPSVSVGEEHPQVSSGDVLDGSEGPSAQIMHATLFGRVSVNKSGVPDENMQDGLAGMTVELVDAAAPSEVLFVATTQGGQGTFAFENLPAGEYMARVRLPQNAAANGGHTEGGYVYASVNGSRVIRIEEEETAGIGISFVLTFSAEVNGSVVSAQGDTSFFGSLVVQLLDPQGRVVAQTNVDKQGNYSFLNPPVSQTGRYNVRFVFPSSEGMSGPGEDIALALAPGQSAQVAPQKVADNSPPRIVLALHGGDCDCGHWNPDSITLRVTDETAVSAEWTITGSGGAVVARGSTEAELNAAVAALANGDYAVEVVASDLAGNESRARVDILVTN